MKLNYVPQVERRRKMAKTEATPLGRCDFKQYEHCGPHERIPETGQRLPPFGCKNWIPDETFIDAEPASITPDAIPSRFPDFNSLLEIVGELGDDLEAEGLNLEVADAIYELGRQDGLRQVPDATPPADIEAEIVPIEARVNAASGAPWKVCGASDKQCSCGIVFGDGGKAYLCSMTTVDEADPAYPDDQRIKNATFIAHARMDIPRLIEIIRQQQRKIDEQAAIIRCWEDDSPV